MLVAMSAAGVFAVFGRVRGVAVRCMSVMSGLFVVTCFVMLGRLGMVSRGVLVVFGCFFVMIGCSL